MDTSLSQSVGAVATYAHKLSFGQWECWIFLLSVELDRPWPTEELFAKTVGHEGPGAQTTRSFPNSDQGRNRDFLSNWNETKIPSYFQYESYKSYNILFLTDYVHTHKWTRVEGFIVVAAARSRLPQGPGLGEGRPFRRDFWCFGIWCFSCGESKFGQF